MPEGGPRTDVEPFVYRAPGDELDDLRRRLRTARWPEAATVDDWSQGVPLAWLQDLCAYWADGYDWRRCEDRLAALPQVRTAIDGLGIHAIHVRSPHSEAPALVMTHGWPGSVVELLDVIGPLTDPTAHGGDADDAVHLVCPSLPGYGFSDKPTEPGWGVPHIADAWVELMARLGYDRFYAQGGDWGSEVTTVLGTVHPEKVIGIHLNMASVGPGRGGTDDLTPEEQAALADMAEHQEWGIGYSTQQATRPQTLGYGLTDSPIGQCAWIAEKYWAWTDHDGDPTSALSRDQMLDNITLYWLTRTAASSARLYWEAGFARASAGRSGSAGGPRPKVQVPTGVSVYPREIVRPSRRWCERRYPDLRFYDRPAHGGHFAAWEEPESFVEQVRSALRTMR